MPTIFPRVFFSGRVFGADGLGVVADTSSTPSLVVLWIFGYGSLLWRPDFAFVERVRARVHGFERRLDQGSPDHRGTEERLGRVANLVPRPGAVCSGLAYRVDERDTESVLLALDHREKGGYERAAVTAFATREGVSTTLACTTWIAPPENRYHLGAAPLAMMVAQIRAAVGPSGANVEYVARLDAILRALEIEDPHVAELAAALR